MKRKSKRNVWNVANLGACILAVVAIILFLSVVIIRESDKPLPAPAGRGVPAVQEEAPSSKGDHRMPAEEIILAYNRHFPEISSKEKLTNLLMSLYDYSLVQSKLTKTNEIIVTGEELRLATDEDHLNLDTDLPIGKLDYLKLTILEDKVNLDVFFFEDGTSPVPKSLGMVQIYFPKESKWIVNRKEGIWKFENIAGRLSVQGKKFSPLYWVSIREIRQAGAFPYLTKKDEKSLYGYIIGKNRKGTEDVVRGIDITNFKLGTVNVFKGREILDRI